MEVAIIVACDPNFVIGTSENTIPWNLPDDLKFFKETTLGHSIIMGRKTWESLPKKPLPLRQNIVVSRTLPQIENTLIVPSLEDALASATSDKVFIIGGAAIYKTALFNGMVDKIIMTHVHRVYPGTIYFPNQKAFGFVKDKILVQHEDFTIIEHTKA